MKGSKVAKTLAYRRRLFDALSDSKKDGRKRPGSLNAHKQGSKSVRG